MNRPYSLNSARFLRTRTDHADPRPQTAWERSRMAPLEPAPDRWTAGDIALLVAALLVGASAAIACLVLYWLVWP